MNVYGFAENDLAPTVSNKSVQTSHLMINAPLVVDYKSALLFRRTLKVFLPGFNHFHQLRKTSSSYI